MNISQLHRALGEILKDHPEALDAEVITEGCDCDGDVAEVEYQVAGASARAEMGVIVERFPERRYVYLKRSVS